MDGVPDAPWVSRSVSPLGRQWTFIYPVAQSVGLSAQASASLHVSVKHLSHSGLFQSAQFGMWFWAKANGHCPTLGNKTSANVFNENRKTSRCGGNRISFFRRKQVSTWLINAIHRHVPQQATALGTSEQRAHWREQAIHVTEVTYPSSTD